LARDHSRHSAFLTDNNFYGHHVTLNLTVDLKDSTANDLQPLAHDLEVVPDDRLLAGRGGVTVITLFVLVGGVVRGSGTFGPANELRVSMIAPD